MFYSPDNNHYEKDSTLKLFAASYEESSIP